MEIKVLFQGFPGKLQRGFLGWSSMIYIASGKQKILVDTGSFGDAPEIPKRLAQINVKMEEIDTVFLSHFHYDHIINAHLFPNATYLLSKIEAEYVTGGSGDWAVPEYYFYHLEKTGRLKLVESEMKIAEGIRSIYTPGHTPGLMSLLIEDESMPTTLIASDAVKNIAELQTGNVPMAWDTTVSKQTIENIRDRVTRVIPGHDRILHVEKDRIVACHSIHERIQLPPGISDVSGFDLGIPSTIGSEDCPCCKSLVDRRQLHE